MFFSHELWSLVSDHFCVILRQRTIWLLMEKNTIYPMLSTLASNQDGKKIAGLKQNFWKHTNAHTHTHAHMLMQSNTPQSVCCSDGNVLPPPPHFLSTTEVCVMCYFLTFWQLSDQLLFFIIFTRFHNTAIVLTLLLWDQLFLHHYNT